jgi:hypothetical protein
MAAARCAAAILGWAVLQLFCMLCSTLSAVFHWFTTSKQQLALEQSVSFMKLQVELANLKAYKTCIDVASKRQ